MKTALLSILLLFVGYTFGQQSIKLTQETTSHEILSKSSNEIVLKNYVSDLQLENVKTKKGIFYKIKTSNYTSESKLGTPELPMFHQLIEIPAGATAVVSVINQQSQTIDLDNYQGYKLMPHQPSLSKSDDPAKVPFHYVSSIYTTDALSSEPLAIVEKLGNMRSKTIGRLRISPFSYNPITNELTIVTEITVKITFENIDNALLKENKQKYASEVFDNSFGNIIRYEEQSVQKDMIVTYPTTYVIVSDPMFESILQPFIAWKTKKGFNVIEAYTNNPSVGATTTSIKAYLQGLYTNASSSNPAPSYVLFVGDVAQIPSFPGESGSHVSDLYYCEYDGNGDYFPEVYYGRFSANNVNELQPQIDKTLEYEQYTFPDDEFLDNVVLISGVDSGMAPTYGNGQINYGTSMYFNLGHGFNTDVWLYPESEGNVEADIFTAFNRGCSFFNYTAHGYEEGFADPAFDVSEVAGLTNDHKYPTMIGNCCLTNTFTVQNCFGESLMRAANKGAIGYIGGSNSTLWDEDYHWGTGFKAVTVNPVYDNANLGAYDCLMHENGEATSNWYVTQSQMIFSGNMAVTASGSGNTFYYWEIYHLMGDPSLMTYLTQAEPMTVTHVNTDVVGITSLSVNAEPHAYVAVSVNGVLLDAKYTGTGSTVLLSFDAINTIETLDVVVTKQNKQPYMGTVQLIAPTNTDYIVLFSHNNDDATGNNNGNVDYSESINLDVELKNIGDLAGTNVVATLSTTDTYVTITDNTENWGTINAGVAEMIVASYQYQVANNVPDQHVIDFLVTITDGAANTWLNHIFVTVNAPEIEILSLSIDDSPGNGNGHLDIGESALLAITAHNIGHADLTSSLGTIICTSPDITITTASSTIGTMVINNTITGNYAITVSNSAGYGEVVDITNEVGTINYLDSKIFSLAIGLFDEDFESNDFNEYSWTNSSASQWITTTEDPYEGQYCSKSGTLGDQSTSDLTIQLDVTNTGEISFMKKVSSEPSYDYLSFYIDGALQEEWSGDVAWSAETYAVSTGVHTFKWSYRKDQSATAGSDAAWIDNIVFPPFSNESSGAFLSENSIIQLNVYPNPVKNELTIEMENNQTKGNLTINIKDLQGRIVYTNTTISNGKIIVNTNNFANGLYMVEATNGVSTMLRKVVKQ